MEALLTFMVTLFALSFLIFLHELGHLLAAVFVGARVISFNLGLGRSLCRFTAWGIEWRINLIPIGGAVEIAGMQPGTYGEKGGFYSITPLRRILIVIAGPLANILTALVCFSFLFTSGGRIRSFYELTQHIGFLKPQGVFHEAGFRAGDQVNSYDGKSVTGFQDHLLTALLTRNPIQVSGKQFRWNMRGPLSAEQLISYAPDSFEKGVTPKYHQENSLYSFGIVAPASFLRVHEDLFAQRNGGGDRPWQIEPGDQLVWVNGYRIFSPMHLEAVLNSDVLFALVEREGKEIGVRIAYATSDELDYHIQHREQITDWILDHPGDKPYEEVKTLPYLLSSNATVLEKIPYTKRSEKGVRSLSTLLPGDRILAINGKQVGTRWELFNALQHPSALMICFRPDEQNSLKKIPSPSEGDAYLQKTYKAEEIDRLALAKEPMRSGSFVRLAPRELSTNGQVFPQLLKEGKKAIELKNDDSEKALHTRTLWKWQNTQILGLRFEDLQVRDLQGPVAQMTKLLKENRQTFQALITGAISPKWLSGPVGMFSTVYKSKKSGVNEQIYWLGFLSVGLAFFNLLPIPVLDGGHLLFNTIALFTRKKLSPVWLERLTLPFALVLISLILYATYWDILRIFGI